MWRNTKLDGMTPGSELAMRVGRKAGETRRKKIPVKDPITTERIYSDDESDFLRAVDLYRKTTGKQFLSACEFLHCARSIGFSRDPTK